MEAALYRSRVLDNRQEQHAANSAVNSVNYQYGFAKISLDCLEGRGSAEIPLPRLQPPQPQEPARRIAVHHVQHKNGRSELSQHLPGAERNLPHPSAHRRGARRIYRATYRQRRPVEPEVKGYPQPSRHHRGAVWRAVAQGIARDGRRRGRRILAVAAGSGEENGALRFDVFAGQAGFSGGYALLAHRQASRLGQADAEGQALRASRHGSAANQNPARTASLLAREHDLAGARDLYPKSSEV